MAEANTRAWKYTLIIKISNRMVFMWLNEGASPCERIVYRERNQVKRWIETWVMDADTGGGMTEGERGMREGGATTVGDMPQIMNQSVSDALETVREEEWTRAWQEERETERKTTSVRACEPGCKDERHEGRIIRGSARGEVSEEGQWTSCQNMSLQCPKSIVLLLQHDKCCWPRGLAAMDTPFTVCLQLSSWTVAFFFFFLILMQFLFRAKLHMQETDKFL